MVFISTGSVDSTLPRAMTCVDMGAFTAMTEAPDTTANPAALLGSIAEHAAARAIKPISQLNLRFAAQALQAKAGGHLVIKLPEKDGDPVELVYLGKGAERTMALVS